MNFLCPACRTPLPGATAVATCSGCGVEVELDGATSAERQSPEPLQEKAPELTEPEKLPEPTTKASVLEAPAPLKSPPKKGRGKMKGIDSMSGKP